MSVIIRYDRLGKGKSEAPKPHKDEWGKSMTDKSQFRPQTSVIRAELGAIGTSGGGIYGSSRDQGDETLAKAMAWSRRMDVDRTEIEVMAEKLKVGLNKRIDELKAEEAMKQAKAEKAPQTNEKAPTSE